MSNASSTSSTSSYHARGLPNPPSGTASFSNDVTYTGPFNPSPFELLFLVNTAGHDDSLRNVSVGQPHLQFAIDGLICLRAQRASLNAIIEETNVYAANLAFNATASGPSPLMLQGLMTVPSFSDSSERLEHQPPTQLTGLAETYRARIGAAVELAHNQYQLCPRHTGTEPVLSRTAGPAPLVPKLEPSSDLGAIKLEPPSDSDSPSGLTYPSDSASRDSSPIYTQSIGVASASPTPAPEPQPQPAPAPPFNPFNVNDEQLPPASVPFLANGQFNPAFVSIRDAVRANPNLQVNTQTFTNPWGMWTPTRYMEQAEWRATVDEVYEFLCALCAGWHTTAPETVQATVARSADYLRLGIYLGIAVSDDGCIDFLEQTIPGAHGLLTTISMGVTTTMTSGETESSEQVAGAEVTDPDDLVLVFVGIPDHKAQEVTLLDGHIVHVVRMGSAT
ncbi:hypothetical protein Moror_10116 [Moniliophthora roreri MCA 2997]|uniref:Uncharacterized protein n=1 Tax=Moniliophthora roreri (strain MCA 2997) TaxID=1381753 RepID=V2Y1H0_MONRO|nr:hypothetical protein Moror_10116 [Moniliophthora roreri MCA 2997]